MTTMSKETVRVHEYSRIMWENMCQERINDIGALDAMHHMGSVWTGEDLQFSFSIDLPPSRPDRQEALGITGLLFGAHPWATSLTLTLDLELKKHADYPELEGKDAILLVTVEIDTIGKAVLFDTKATLMHYRVEDGHLITQELTLSESVAEMVKWIEHFVELMAGDTRTGELVLDVDIPLAGYYQLMQAVDFVDRNYNWAVLPSDRLEQTLLTELMDEYGPHAFVKARDSFRGLRLLTPNIHVVILEDDDES